MDTKSLLTTTRVLTLSVCIQYAHCMLTPSSYAYNMHKKMHMHSTILHHVRM